MHHCIRPQSWNGQWRHFVSVDLSRYLASTVAVFNEWIRCGGYRIGGLTLSPISVRSQHPVLI
eukprot:8951521-Lingulodinium_polyedra.AAC.1